MKRILRYGSIGLLLTGVCAVECAAKKNQDIPARFVAIQNVFVLPIVNARAGKKAGVNMDNLQESVVNIVKRKHYPVSAAGVGDAGQIAEEDLQTALPKVIGKLGPADARWVMVVCLEDVASKVTFGSTGNAELSGYLFDKQSGELIWQGKGVGQAGQGGLIGMPLKGFMNSAAIGSALDNLFAGLPNRPKPGK